MQIWRTAVKAAAIGTMVLGLVTLLPSGATAGSSPPTSSPPASSGLLASNLPKTVVLNPATGAVISVKAGEPASITSRGTSPDVSNHNICNPGDGCFFSGRAPTPIRASTAALVAITVVGRTAALMTPADTRPMPAGGMPVASTGSAHIPT